MAAPKLRQPISISIRPVAGGPNGEGGGHYVTFNNPNAAPLAQNVQGMAMDLPTMKALVVDLVNGIVDEVFVPAVAPGAQPIRPPAAAPAPAVAVPV